MLPVLACGGCERHLQLPYRRFLNSTVVEPYWPDGDMALAWVCDGCGRYNSTKAHDIEWMTASTLPPPSPSQAFWRVEIPCRAPGCSSKILAHAQTFGQTSRRKLGLMIANASPPPGCDFGHVVSPEQSYPERVDFVEWTGGDDYIT